MSRSIFRVLLLNSLILFSALSSIASAGGPNRLFTGLWEGIDNEDGSRVLVSISEGNGNGELTVRLSDSFFSRCVAEGYVSSPGLAEGPATVNKKTLTWDSYLKCFDSDGNSGTFWTGIFEFYADQEGKTLVSDDGMVYFRVSR